MNPPVMQLPVHLENEQRVFYKNNVRSAINAIASIQAVTPFTAYLNLNCVDEEATNYLYEEIPQHYVYNSEGRTWSKRVQKYRF